MADRKKPKVRNVRVWPYRIGAFTFTNIGNYLKKIGEKFLLKSETFRFEKTKKTLNQKIKRKNNKKRRNAQTQMPKIIEKVKNKQDY